MTTTAEIFMTSGPTVKKKMFQHSRGSATRGAADWLCLAAAPTFAIIALVTALAGGQADMLCATTQDASPLGGMIPMYLLMSAFHSASWLRLISGKALSHEE